MNAARPDVLWWVLQSVTAACPPVLAVVVGMAGGVCAR
jgi:hypothetical protein